MLIREAAPSVQMDETEGEKLRPSGDLVAAEVRKRGQDH